MLKPGYKTTEFLATIAFNVAVLVSALADALSPHWAAIAAAAATGLYALSRGLAKLYPPKDTPPAGTP